MKGFSFSPSSGSSFYLLQFLKTLFSRSIQSGQNPFATATATASGGGAVDNIQLTMI